MRCQGTHLQPHSQPTCVPLLHSDETFDPALEQDGDEDDADFEGLSSEKAGAEALAALRASGLTAVPPVQPEPVRCDALSLTHMRVFS